MFGEWFLIGFLDQTDLVYSFLRHVSSRDVTDISKIQLPLDSQQNQGSEHK